MPIQTPDITFVTPPAIAPSYPHSGIAYLAGTLEHHGFRTRVYDLNLLLHREMPPHRREDWHPAQMNRWKQDAFLDRFFREHNPAIDRHLEAALEGDPPMVGLTVQASTMSAAMRICHRLKELRPDVKLIMGGPSFFLVPEDGGLAVRANGFPLQGEPERLERLERLLSILDLVVVGEGEETLLEIMAHAREHREYRHLQGTAWFGDGRYHVNPARPPITDLDSIPFPHFGGFPLGSYDSPKLPGLFSRGCPMRCTFCIDRALWGDRVRVRSPENVAAEIKQREQELGIFDFELGDLALNSNLKNLARICERLVEQGSRGRWCGNLYPTVKMDRGYFELLARAGAQSVNLGLETGSSRVLRRMGKHITAEDASDLLRACKHGGVSPLANIIVGFPMEYEEDFRQSMRFVEQNRRNIDQVINLSICTVFYDSEMGQDPERFGVLPESLGDIKGSYESTGWVDQNGLTYSERYERYERFYFMLEDLGYKAPRLYASDRELLEPGPPDERERDLAWLREICPPQLHPRGHIDSYIDDGLSHQDPRIRSGAVRLIGLTRNERYAPRLPELLGDPDPQVKEMALRSMGQLALPEHLDPLRDALESFRQFPPHIVRDLARLHWLYERRREEGRMATAEQPPAVQIVAGEVLDGQGQPASAFSEGQPLSVDITYQVNAPLARGELRVVFLAEQPAAWRGYPVCTEESSRSGLLVRAEVGSRGRMVMEFPALRLAPGSYQVTIGAWDLDGSQDWMDVRHATRRFEISGIAEQVMAVPARWSLEPVDVPQEPGSRFRDLVLGGESREPGSIIRPDGALQVSARVDTRGCPEAELRAELRFDERPLTRFHYPEPLAEAQCRLELNLGSVNLLQGAYELVLLLVRQGTGEPLDEAHANFLVKSRPSDGAGLIYNPVSWRHADVVG